MMTARSMRDIDGRMDWRAFLASCPARWCRTLARGGRAESGGDEALRAWIRCELPRRVRGRGSAGGH